MPIQINLMTDALAARELRKRDPVKRTAYIGVLAIVLMLAWYSSAVLENMVAKSNLDQVQSEIQTRTNDYNAAVVCLKTLHADEDRLKALNDLSSARFLQGNLMNALQQLYVSNVNLMRMEVSQRFTHSSADSKSPSLTESTVINLDAKDASPNPGDQVNHYKDAIGELTYFKSQLEPVDGLNLASLSPPQGTPGGSPFVLFTITCRFKDQVR